MAFQPELLKNAQTYCVRYLYNNIWYILKNPESWAFKNLAVIEIFSITLHLTILGNSLLSKSSFHRLINANT